MTTMPGKPSSANAKKYAADPEKEIDGLRTLIREAVELNGSSAH